MLLHARSAATQHTFCELDRLQDRARCLHAERKSKTTNRFHANVHTDELHILPYTFFLLAVLLAFFLIYGFMRDE